MTAGPAVKFKVEGLVYQQRICYTLTVCTSFPPADYPRQLVKVTALDAQGRVATGYTGTVTFTNPAFGGGAGGLADSTLTKGVGVFPVLEPKLTWKAQGEPWDSLCGLGGIALHVRDTVDPSIAGCENIAAGGAITLVHPDVYTSVTPSGCATGCLQEPTNTIVLDPNFLNPKITAAATTQISITGETLQQQFYVQPVDIGVITVAVGDTSSLTLCSQCTASTQLLLQRSEVPLTVGSLVDYTNTLTPSNPATEVTWTPSDLQKCIGGSDYCFAIQQAQIFLNTTLGPTCYDDVARIYQVACLGG